MDLVYPVYMLSEINLFVCLLFVVAQYKRQSLSTPQVIYSLGLVPR